MAFVVHFSPFDGSRVSSNPKKKTLAKENKENHVIMHFLTSDTNNWSRPVNIWSGPAAFGSNRPDCLAAKKINVEPCNCLKFCMSLSNLV